MNNSARKIHLGISTCPNDTFAFHAILERRVDTGGLEFDIELRDVEELNQALLAGRYDVAKASFHAALYLSDEMVVLPSGSALGYGVGPVLLANRPAQTPSTVIAERGTARILCPGRMTTATLLYRLFHGVGDIEQVVFSDIMPRLKRGSADFGVCIHEGRFAYEEQGLHLIEDLGTAWESQTGCPLPLGGILARRRLGDELLSRVQSAIQRSLEYATNHRQETLETMRRYAQEFDDRVLFAHVDLYVNEWTRDLGSIGAQALQRLSSLAKERGLVDKQARDLEVFLATQISTARPTQ